MATQREPTPVILVTDDGYTLVDATAKHMDVAVEWRDLGRFEDFLVERLTGSRP